MSTATSAQPTPLTKEEIRKRAAKAIATKIIVSVAVTVVAHVIATAINAKLDEHLFPDTEDQPTE